MNRRIVMVAVAAAVLVVACSSDDAAERSTPTTSTSSRPHVLVLGDSNTVFAETDVRSAMRDHGVVPDLQAISGFGLKESDLWLAALPDLLEKDPDAVLVALGTNDAVDAGNAEAFSERLDRMMTALGDRPVVWFTHFEGRPEPIGASARMVNAAIRAAPSKWKNLTVVDLAPDLAADPSLLEADLVHFSATGRPWFAEQLAVAARRAVSSGG
jgi:lysophospholipase L1-like esterase